MYIRGQPDPSTSCPGVVHGRKMQSAQGLSVILWTTGQKKL
nr:MAG TPA: hypothetical protein [Caudoviricetes sp.]